MAEKVHNEIFYSYYDSSSLPTGLTAIRDRVNMVANANSGFIECKGSLYHGVQLSKVQSILNNPGNCINDVLSGTGMSILGRVSLSTFTTGILSLTAKTEEYKEIYDSICNYEAAVLTDPLLTARGKRVILITTSIARHSIYCAKKKPKKNTDPDWTIEFGHTIDFHLAEMLNELDLHAFLPNTGSRVTMTHKGVRVQGVVKIDANSGITITHLEKVNNPESLKQYVENTGKGDIPELQFPISRVDFKKFEIALLKTAYMLAFEKYGYPLILSSAFDIVREQLKNPEKDIYPIGFWTRQSVLNKSNAGVHLITTPGFEGFQAIFILSTGSRDSGYGVYLPVSGKTVIDVVKAILCI
jgi:hypothetical protein